MKPMEQVAECIRAAGEPAAEDDVIMWIQRVMDVDEDTAADLLQRAYLQGYCYRPYGNVYKST